MAQRDVAAHLADLGPVSPGGTVHDPPTTGPMSKPEPWEASRDFACCEESGGLLCAQPGFCEAPETEQETFIQRQLAAFRDLRRDHDELAGLVTRLAGDNRQLASQAAEMAGIIEELGTEINRVRSLAIDLAVRGPERNPTIRRARQQLYRG